MNELKSNKFALQDVMNKDSVPLITDSAAMIYQLNANHVPGTASVFALISTRGGEGTTYSAIAILEALPQLLGNVSAVLVDANIAHTDLSYQVDFPKRGWTHWLKDKSAYSIEDAVIPWKNHSSISVLPVGSYSNIIGKHYIPQFVEALSALKTKFDFILIDCQPFFSDKMASLFCTGSDNVVIVIEAENTRKYLVKKMIEELHTMNINILGAVLNKRRYHIPRWIYNRLF